MPLARNDDVNSLAYHCGQNDHISEARYVCYVTLRWVSYCHKNDFLSLCVVWGRDLKEIAAKLSLKEGHSLVKVESDNIRIATG